MELLRIGLVFAFVILLLARRVELWITLCIGGVALGLLYRLPLVMIGAEFFRGLIEPQTLDLVFALLFILLLSEIMKEAGQMRTMIDSFGAITNDLRAVVALLPAMIGLMPIVGGALVSAPLVVEASDALKLSPERKTFLNYWFRHIWEYFLPTYPGVILASALLGVSLRTIASYHFPLTLAAIAGGIYFGFRGVGKGEGGREGSGWWMGVKGVISSLFPLLVVLFMVIVLRVQLSYSLLVAIGIELLRSRRVWGRMKGILVRTGQSAQVLITVVMVIYFKQMLEASQAVDSFHQSLSQLGVPSLVLLVVLPFSIGLMTGLTIAFVGVAFPILLPILKGGNNLSVYLMLAYASGFCGVLLSPLHLCLVLTKDYFKAELRKVYGILLAPVGVVWGVALLLFSLFAVGIFT
jgi:integral membrane protein (TIGR00529 family)